ncbi:hypothetical protein H0H87_009892, partial [Tephrocybe sp. NHM501043]
ALFRDGFKCTLCGVYDRSSVETYNAVNKKYKKEGQTKLVYTEVAHILSESDYATTVFAILNMFGLEEKTKALYGAGVNGLRNVITVNTEFHKAFDQLKLWLEPVPDTDNTYNICGVGVDTFMAPFKSKRITFSVDSSVAAGAGEQGITVDLPDLTMLALRATFSRVARMSGAAEHIDLILRDPEDITVLADDGSMAGLLSFRLSTAQPRVLQFQG